MQNKEDQTKKPPWNQQYTPYGQPVLDEPAEPKNPQMPEMSMAQQMRGMQQVRDLSLMQKTKEIQIALDLAGPVETVLSQACALLDVPAGDSLQKQADACYATLFRARLEE